MHFGYHDEAPNDQLTGKVQSGVSKWADLVFDSEVKGSQCKEWSKEAACAVSGANWQVV